MYLPIRQEAFTDLKAILPEENNFFACCSSFLESLSAGVDGKDTPLAEHEAWITRLSGVG